MSYENPNIGGKTLNEVYAQIMSRAPEHDINPSLDAMKKIAHIMADPQKSFRTIHITGTNGKGSTARMTEAICREYGLRTGLYASPHLESVTERIVIDGQPISDDYFVDIYDQTIDFINLVDEQSVAEGKPRMSFFEVLTVMAMWAFADSAIDVAIIEVGMGGLWDATNVFDADAAIIGPIDMDHMQWLGGSVEQIAKEKAGIIKKNSSVVIAPQPHEEAVMPILRDYADKTGAKNIICDGIESEVISRVPAVGGQVVTLRTPSGVYEDVPISMFGQQQAHNALAALCAAEIVLPVSSVLNGDIVAQALSSVKIPGRVEIVRTSPTIILDGGHNINAVSALRETLEENFDFSELVGVTSMMSDKNVEDVLSVLEPVIDTLVVTQNSYPQRAMPPEELEKIAISVFGPDRVIRRDFFPDALQAAVDCVDSGDETGVGYGRGILVFGSFVTAGDARALLKSKTNEILSLPKEQRVSKEEQV